MASILKTIKAGKCYIRVASEHDVALVLNYCQDHKIRWMSEAAIEYVPLDHVSAIGFEHMPYSGRLRIVAIYDIDETVDDFTDITDKFFI